ncbi:MFS transporter [Peloplasma aerotolerans]|uniref:MFS transporter n=1 Tax=Peloplasma aerotolerans TaxID=3044389 RepID=A0AAW6UB89_9MOLU|nr:MFS transporter [Mariniplasma sp. M4Ah]MDI6453244.1 MFS transporter [Mariniplasma sp. M4Ah]
MIEDITTENNEYINRGKTYQIALFPFNNAATNTYFTLMLFITYYGGYYLSGGFIGGILSAAAMGALTVVLSTLVTGMRIFDGITDPFIGALIDKTNSKLGKFRPYMIFGNLLLAISVIAMFFLIRPIELSWLRWVLFVVCYVVYVFGYTAQTSVTKAGQTCITNDPKQRSQFVVWNMIGMIGSIVLVNMIGNGLLPMFVEPLDIANDFGAQYNPEFYNILVPICIGLSMLYTGLAVFAIWKKDVPENWGIDKETKSAKLRDFISVLKHNNQIRWLVFSAGANKLASTIATSSAVAVLIYGIMMGSYNGLYIPMYVASFLFMGILFVVGAKLAGKKGQKRAVTQFTVIAFLFYIGIVILLLMWNQDDLNFNLSLLHWRNDGSIYIATNLFTLAWIVMFGLGYGAYNLGSEMVIPMIADCTDYETYRTGNYIPGMMGTLFSLIDKFVSSFATLLLSVFIVGFIPALNGKLPSTGIVISDYTGVLPSALITFALIPMVSWVITLISMRFYKLNGNKLREIQAVNAIRKKAISLGMPKEKAMATWTTIGQVPKEFINEYETIIEEKTEKQSMIDKLYNKIWGKHEAINEDPASNVIEIPKEYLSQVKVS